VKKSNDFFSSALLRIEEIEEAVRASLLENFEAQKGFKETQRGTETIPLAISLDISKGKSGEIVATFTGPDEDLRKLREDEFGSGSNAIKPKANFLKFKNGLIYSLRQNGWSVLRK
jgi:hypothetical protein